jgi:hypothetical protein
MAPPFQYLEIAKTVTKRGTATYFLPLGFRDETDAALPTSRRQNPVLQKKDFKKSPDFLKTRPKLSPIGYRYSGDTLFSSAHSRAHRPGRKNGSNINQTRSAQSPKPPRGEAAKFLKTGHSRTFRDISRHSPRITAKPPPAQAAIHSPFVIEHRSSLASDTLVSSMPSSNRFTSMPPVSPFCAWR